MSEFLITAAFATQSQNDIYETYRKSIRKVTKIEKFKSDF